MFIVFPPYSQESIWGQLREVWPSALLDLADHAIYQWRDFSTFCPYFFLNLPIKVWGVLPLTPYIMTQHRLPVDYSVTLNKIKQQIQTARLRTILAANSAMVLLYWDIGQMILSRQQREGWGAKVIDRLSTDLRESFPDMRGLSPRNLKYMRSFASAWSRPIVQEVLAQLTWYHTIT